ncbi:MAG: hypothetical protein ACREIH_04295 [Nitrospiraceae bacterium]
MLSLEVEKVAGLEALQGVFKYRAPEPHVSGMYYVGILTFPFRDSYFQFNAESLERGTTGLRECVVFVMQRDALKKVMEEAADRSDLPGPTSLQDFWAQDRATPPPKHLSDDEEYDAVFPNYPLSKVRALQAHLKATLCVHPSLHSAEKYRVGGTDRVTG